MIASFESCGCLSDTLPWLQPLVMSEQMMACLHFHMSDDWVDGDFDLAGSVMPCLDCSH